jgi:hypothetical protein
MPLSPAGYPRTLGNGIIQLLLEPSEALTNQSKGMEAQLAEALNLGNRQDQPKNRASY